VVEPKQTLLAHIDRSTEETGPSAAEASRSRKVPGVSIRDIRFGSMRKEKAVLVDGQIALRDGACLEMFACTRNTKEHESTCSPPNHAGILLVHTGPGHPWGAEPATRVAISADVHTADRHRDRRFLFAGSTRRVKEKSARGSGLDQGSLKLGKAPWSIPFVFAVSGFWKDDMGKEHYQAEGVDFVCVSNFGTAMGWIDIPVKSSQSERRKLEFQAVHRRRFPPAGPPPDAAGVQAEAGEAGEPPTGVPGGERGRRTRRSQQEKDRHKRPQAGQIRTQSGISTLKEYWIRVAMAHPIRIAAVEFVGRLLSGGSGDDAAWLVYCATPRPFRSMMSAWTPAIEQRAAPPALSRHVLEAALSAICRKRWRQPTPRTPAAKSAARAQRARPALDAVDSDKAD